MLHLFHRPQPSAGLSAVLLLGAVACVGGASVKQQAKAKTHYDIGTEEMRQGNMRQALRELRVAAEADPELAEAHNALGIVYHALGHLDESLAHYDRSVALKPGFSEAHNNRGSLLIDMGRYDAAIAAFKQALSDILYGTPAWAEGNMGWAYFKKGEVDQAIEHLRNAVAMNPKFCRGYEWLVRIGLDTDKPELALNSLVRFDKQCLSDPDVVKRLSPSYLQEMRYYKGLSHLRGNDPDAARAAFKACADDSGQGFGQKCADSLQALN